jgi:hypothetical protein
MVLRMILSFALAACLLAPGAQAQLTADQLNKLSLESLTAPPARGYAPAHHAAAHYVGSARRTASRYQGGRYQGARYQGARYHQRPPYRRHFSRGFAAAYPRRAVRHYRPVAYRRHTAFAHPMVRRHIPRRG